MIRRAALWLLASSFAAPYLSRAALAQAPSDLRLEAGYARVRPTEGAESDAALIAAFWRRPLETWTLLASGSLTFGRDSISAAQGVAAFSVPWLADDRLRSEGGIAGSRFSLSDDRRGGNLNAFGRQHYLTDRGGAWLGGSISRSARDGERKFSSGGDAGAWGRLGFMYGSGSVAVQRSDDFDLVIVGSVAAEDPDQRQFTLLDTELVLEARGGPNSLALSWARRRALDLRRADVTAISASGILQVTERMAFTASAGRQLADPLRGLPQADLISATVRVSLGEKPLPIMVRSEIARATLETSPLGGGELIVHVFAADTMIVEVAGDFSDWKPLPLERVDGLLVARVRLQPGKYRVAVRVNLGPWRSPRNLARVKDDYGGEAGLVVVP